MPVISTTVNGDYLVERWKNGKVTRRPSDNIIIDLYLSGISEKAVSDQLKINRRIVRRVLLANRVAVRGRSEAELLKWSKMDTDQRLRQVAAANDAARGRKRSVEERSKGALSRQANPVHNVSSYEHVLGEMLADRGVATVPQLAIGPYNCDLAADPVAVEVWGGKWHLGGDHAARTPERFRYIMDRGWNILAVLVYDAFPLTPAVADYVATYVKKTRRFPSRVRQYRVIWGAGEFSTGGCANDDKITVVQPFTGRRDPTTGQYERVTR